MDILAALLCSVLLILLLSYLRLRCLGKKIEREYKDSPMFKSRKEKFLNDLKEKKK